MTFYMGKNITQSQLDTLVAVTSYELFQKITNPDPEVASLLERLQRVRSIDRKAYDAVKKRLPYFTCSEFAGNIRKAENFTAAHGLVLDLDHCLTQEEAGKNLRARLAADTRVLLLFTSPGGEGLKLVFRFNEPCLSAKIFSDFYKWFAGNFARQYQIETYIDFTTHDASRVCFLSADKDAHHNPLCDALDWKQFADAFQDCPWNENTESNRPETEQPAGSENSSATDQTEKKDIAPDVYAEILKKLNPRASLKKSKIIHVPEQLNNIEEPIRNAAAGYQIELKEVRNIHYGKKLVFQHGVNFTEINVYHGKNGFTVTITPKAGSNAELGEVMKRITEQVLWDMMNIPYTQKTLTKNVTKN